MAGGCCARATRGLTSGISSSFSCQSRLSQLGARQPRRLHWAPFPRPRKPLCRSPARRRIQAPCNCLPSTLLACTPTRSLLFLWSKEFGPGRRLRLRHMFRERRRLPAAKQAFCRLGRSTPWQARSPKWFGEPHFQCYGGGCYCCRPPHCEKATYRGAEALLPRGQVSTCRLQASRNLSFCHQHLRLFWGQN